MINEHIPAEIRKCLPFTAGNNFNYLRKDGNNVNIVVGSNQGGIGYGSSSLMYLYTIQIKNRP
jgi:hypothetical protein